MMSVLKRNKKKINFIIVLIVAVTAYVFNPYKLEYVGYQSKVWAHRVNSLEKLNYTQKFYKGIELDLVFDSINNTFDVNHPPAESVNLNLDTYFSKISDKDLKLWLDFKNLSEINAEKSAEILDQLTKKYSLKNENILVESTEMHNLKTFKNKGFKTSFYLPPLVGLTDENKLVPTIDSIKQLLIQYPTSGISCNANAYDVIKEYFKEEKKYLWHIYKPYSRHQVKNYQDFRKYVSDPTVEAILIQVALPVGNR
ncbi:hypothetical protein SAMN05421741_10340 [Paenimyroides ummariense]|uniref:Uncharacterized protein n=1 Tax=Paenimyroides ummariense TaxID=913024 RepID=A0A1I4XLG3_9FLAO|nr:hypothetical protein [Paenimyroides ummariense]SFN26652.1 hypothetical protein SAMN05421741_10340 [Paenimyroides ummariense]